MGTIAGVALSAALLLADADADSAGWQRAGHTLLICYGAAASKLGTQSCQPPPSIVGAVFGECAHEESNFVTAIEKWHGNDAQFADDMLETMHHQKATEIEAIVLHAQILHRKCP